jgi:hypothetical protein
MRIKNLGVGVESVTVWQTDDEVHLPKNGQLAPTFLPQYRPLDEILRRPSLDERLPALLQPATLDPDLLDPSTLSEARQSARDGFARQAAGASGRRRALFEMAASYLDESVVMDDEVRRSLAVLLRG